MQVDTNTFQGQYIRDSGFPNWLGPVRNKPFASSSGHGLPMARPLIDVDELCASRLIIEVAYVAA